MRCKGSGGFLLNAVVLQVLWHLCLYESPLMKYYDYVFWIRPENQVRLWWWIASLQVSCLSPSLRKPIHRGWVSVIDEEMRLARQHGYWFVVDKSKREHTKTTHTHKHKHTNTQQNTLTVRTHTYIQPPTPTPTPIPPPSRRLPLSPPFVRLVSFERRTECNTCSAVNLLHAST